MGSTLESSDTFTAGKTNKIGTDLMRLIKNAADGEFDPGKLLPAPGRGGFADLLMGVADNRSAILFPPIAVCTLDCDPGFIDHHDLALKLLGLNPEEALHQGITALDILELNGGSGVVTIRETCLAGLP